MDQQTGKYILIAGIFIVIAGLLVYFFHDYFKWIGRLPGDIRIEKRNFRFYFPWVTMILLSIVITIIISIFRRFF
jgi:H+/Cl- antiporter ClcA